MSNLRFTDMKFLQLTHNRLLSLVAVVVSTLLAACNNDIFVDRIPDIETDFTLDGDGGSHSVAYQSTGIAECFFSNDVDYDTWVLRYDSEGNTLDNDAPFSSAARIIYGSPRFSVEIVPESDRLIFNAMGNTYDFPLTIHLTLWYDYAYKLVDFTLTPGQPMEISSVNYISTHVSTVTSFESLPDEVVTNGGMTPLTVEITPYANCKCSARLDADHWATGITGTVPLPTVQGNIWTNQLTDDVDVTLGGGETTEYFSSYVDRDLRVPVEILPGETVRIKVRITYSTLRIGYWALLLAPFADNYYVTQGVCTVTNPVSYKIETEQ